MAEKQLHVERVVTDSDGLSRLVLSDGSTLGLVVSAELHPTTNSNYAEVSVRIFATQALIAGLQPGTTYTRQSA